MDNFTIFSILSSLRENHFKPLLFSKNLSYLSWTENTFKRISPNDAVTSMYTPSRQQKMPILTLCLVLFQEFYPPAPSTRGSLEFAPLAAVSNQTDQCSPSALALETAIGSTSNDSISWSDWFTFGCVEALSRNHLSNALSNSRLDVRLLRLHDNDCRCFDRQLFWGATDEEITNVIESCFRIHIELFTRKDTDLLIKDASNLQQTGLMTTSDRAFRIYSDRPRQLLQNGLQS